MDKQAAARSKKRGRSKSQDEATAGLSNNEKRKKKFKDSTMASSSKTIKKNKKKHKNDNSQAKSKSTKAKSSINPSISISKTDHNATLKLLKTMDWTMAKNTSRRNVIRADDKVTPRNKMGKPYCMSFIFGKNMKDPTGTLSYWSTKYPKVYEELQTLMGKYDPKFQYTHITLNCNLRCKRHTDGGNAGPSYIAAFGNFEGGGLMVEQPGGGKPEVTLDLKSQFVKFNGKTQPHETAPFKGERFTLVYYTSDIIPPTVDRRAVSTLPSKADDVSSDFSKKFEAMKAKLGRNKRR